MTTYCESKGYEFFNWNKALDNPPESGSITHENMCKMAESWVTCACGNICTELPRLSNGAPQDDILRGLGGMFTSAVKLCNWDCARTLLDEIESRASEVLADYV
jgi:hypothetical protein